MLVPGLGWESSELAEPRTKQAEALCRPSAEGLMKQQWTAARCLAAGLGRRTLDRNGPATRGRGRAASGAQCWG